ncbi:MAG: phosphotransferase family protein [Acidimicrobiales bacterium]
MAELTSDLIAWIEGAAGGPVVSSKQITAGTRLGYFIDVRGGDGHVHELFLQLGRNNSMAAPNLFHGCDVEAEVLRALEPIGIPVPHVWATDQQLDAMLVDRVPGEVWFHPPREAADREAVAKDFVTQLARCHAARPAELHLPSLGPIKSLRAHQADQLDGIARLIDATGPADTIDPLVTFTLQWLRDNIPEIDGPVVLVQGDTGPGNFLYADGKVTGVIDWELAHLGDPMDDIAWFSWRATQHGFPDFPARMREYEALTGIAIDDARVRYYRLNAFGRLGPSFGLPDMGLTQRHGAPGVAADDSDRAADGSWVIMSMLHRRMRLEATAAALGTPVPSRDVEVEAPAKSHAPLYDQVLEQLQTMVGRIADPATANIGKAVARQIKYIRELDRNGDLFAAQELDDIGRLLGRPPASLRDARAALVARVREGGLGIDDYLDYHWRRLRRDDHVMRFASGALFDRSWPSLR